MRDCCGTSELRRYLDGDLDAAEDRLLAHVELCTACQDQLERLTAGCPVLGEAAVFDTMRCDAGASTDRPATDGWIAPGSRAEMPPGSAGGGPGWDATGASILAAAAVAAGGTEGSPGGGDTEYDPERTASITAGAQEVPPAGGESGRECWPSVAGYEVLEKLGEGGMGVVYKARHRGLNRLVALKMIRGGGHARAEEFARFRIEAEAVARLDHPNIIQIYDIGEADGLPFVALELLEGGSLDDRLAATPQPSREAAERMRILARAIGVAHAAGIVHRDLKPGNVLYTADGVLKISDFGLAKRVDSDARQTLSGQIMGSPSYMAPEQAKGNSRDVAPAADVYALGAILYEMLTGRPPFKGSTPMETVRQVIDDDPVAPSRLVPRVPRDLETICLKCLQKDPARRYGSAPALAEDLERYLHGETITARRTPAWERAAKWARRRPAAALLWTAAVLLVAGAIAGLFAYQESRLRHTGTIATALDEGSRLERQADSARIPPEFRAVQSGVSGLLPQLKGLDDDPRIKAAPRPSRVEVECRDDTARSIRIATGPTRAAGRRPASVR